MLSFTTESDNSKRYKKTNTNKVDLLSEKYIFGCEFEFYLLDSINIDNLILDLYNISNTDLLVNDLGIPSTNDSSNCMHLKPDATLENHGLEISTPMCTYDELLKYTKEINNLIDKYGYTNNDTGLHIHISTTKSNGINLDFYKFALLSNEQKLLDSWNERNCYCRNVMNIIELCSKKNSKIIKNKKDRMNLHKISNNRIEIRTIGGDNYHLKTDKILDELECFRAIFIDTLSKDSKNYIKLRNEHLATVNSLGDECKVKFAEFFLQ